MHVISHHFGRCLSRHCNLSCTFSITSTWSSTMNVPLTKEALLLAPKMLQHRKRRWSYFLKGTGREKVRPLGWLQGRNVSHKQKDRRRLGSNSLKATERTWDLTRSWTLMSYHSQCPHVETSDPIRTRRRTDLTRTLSSDGSNKLEPATQRTIAPRYVIWRFCTFLKALKDLVRRTLSLTNLFKLYPNSIPELGT